jgi:Mg-chelatase subunit ChlD
MNIADLTASGNTYIPAGMMWGWRTLTDAEPFSAAGSPDRQRLLILMTDGENTRSQMGTMHTGTDTNAANALTLDLCTAIKNSEIKIATISYPSGTSAADDQMLTDCASSASMYYDASNPSDLEKAFANATERINEIRLLR